MPTYEYRCESCGRSFDVVQSFQDAALTACEVCAGTLRKVFAPVGIVFKGSGFYKNDSRSGASRASGGTKDDAAATSKEAVSSNGADSTPAKSADGAKAGSSDGGSAPASTPAPSKPDQKKGSAPAPAAPTSS